MDQNDLQAIQANYRNMSDAQLLKLWNEKYKFKNEVVLLLKSELNSRNIELHENNLSEHSISSENNQLNDAHKSLKQLNEKKKFLSEEVKYYIERNQNREFIVKKLSEKHQVNTQIIEEIFSAMKRKGNLLLFCGILFSIPAILRLVIIGNQNHNPNLMWDLLYFLVTASASLAFIYLGFNLKKKYR